MNERENCEVCLGFYKKIAKKNLQMYSEELNRCTSYSDLVKTFTCITNFAKDWEKCIGECEMVTMLKCRIETTLNALDKLKSRRLYYFWETAREIKVVIDEIIELIDI